MSLFLLQALRALLEAGADVNAFSGGQTALHYAAFCGHAEIAAALIEHGACITRRDHHGHTAADAASQVGHVGLAKTLASTPTQAEVCICSALGVLGIRDLKQRTFVSTLETGNLSAL